MTAMLARSETMSLADAKTHLGGVVARVERSGVPCVLTRYNKPVALIAPIPPEEPRQLRARGMLSGLADHGLRAAEEGAFERAMVAKHARAS